MQIEFLQSYPGKPDVLIGAAHMETPPRQGETVALADEGGQKVFFRVGQVVWDLSKPNSCLYAVGDDGVPQPVLDHVQVYLHRMMSPDELARACHNQQRPDQAQGKLFRQ